MKPRVKSSKLFSMIIVVVMIISLTAVLLISAGAVNDNMNVASHSVANNSPALASLDAGQVWTGKNVSTAGIFGSEPGGQFTVTLSAIGGASGTGSPVDAAGLTFDDTFKAEYAFVTENSQMTFYLDGAAHTVGLTGDVYQYTEGAGATLVEVTFNQASNTVRYFIGQNALKTAAPGAVSGAEVYNSLAFGVRLLDAFDAAGTQYITNEPNSCTARYNTLETRTEYVGGSSTNTYNNTEKGMRWEILTEVHNEARFAGGIDKLQWIQLLVGPDIYQFDIAPDAEIDFDISTAGDDDDDVYNWSIWIKNGTYVKNTHNLRITNPEDPLGQDRLLINANRTWSDEKGKFISINSIISGIVEEGFVIDAVNEFTVDQYPSDSDPTAIVKVGSTTYTGTVNTPVSASWSFTDASGAVVTLVDADTLTVTTSTSSMINTTETVPVTQPHDDYGIIMLDANQVAGASDEGVAGDSDEVLPQTGGISTPTLIGILGLALIAVGGTCFVVCRRKFLN